MRTDVLDLVRFYESRLGLAVQRMLCERLRDAWPDLSDCRTGIFGFGWPYVEAVDSAERVILLAPQEMGALATSHLQKASLPHPHAGAVLTADAFWPLPDASLDRIILVHGLEEAAAPRALIREIWRVLTDDGSLIIIATNRRSAWSMTESTPFSAGRPWTRGQLDRFLRASLFVPSRWSSALFLPPFQAGFLVRAASAWERTGAFLWPALSGVTMVEARKELAMPIGGAKAEKLTARILRAHAPRPSASKAPHE